MTKLTSMQYALMNLIAHHEMNVTNGATPTSHTDVNTWLWADEFAKELGLTEKQVGGLLTTLQEAGHIGMHIDPKKTSKNHTNESAVWFTEEGFKAWQAYDERVVNKLLEKEEEAKPASSKTEKTKTSTPKAEKAETKGTKEMTNNVIDMIAAREGSFKRLVAEVLLESAGKPLTLVELAKAAYGKKAKETGPVTMVLKGVEKAIKVNDLPFQLVREKGTVALLSTAPVKKTRAKKAA